MVEGFRVGVLHDCLDPFLLGELDQFAGVGGLVKSSAEAVKRS